MMAFLQGSALVAPGGSLAAVLAAVETTACPGVLAIWFGASAHSSIGTLLLVVPVRMAATAGAASACWVSVALMPPPAVSVVRRRQSPSGAALD